MRLHSALPTRTIEREAQAREYAPLAALYGRWGEAPQRGGGEVSARGAHAPGRPLREGSVAMETPRAAGAVGAAALRRHLRATGGPEAGGCGERGAAGRSV